MYWTSVIVCAEHNTLLGLTLTILDYGIIALYLLFVLGIGRTLRSKVASADQFLISDRSPPLWVTSLASVAANIGAREFIGLCAFGAKCGVMSAHFLLGGGDS